MHLLDNPVKDYPWGSRTDIATLTERPAPTPGPEAEMWLGAHPAGPSILAGADRSLTELIAADPLAALGADVLDRYSRRLPYLMKVISVARPLSLQVHPNAEQATDGHALGLYHDPWPKPELICALTPFTALAGFRPPEQAAMLLDRLGMAELTEVSALLRAGAVREGLDLLLQRRQITDRVVWAASAIHHTDYALIAHLARQHPGDPACLAPLLLQRHELHPGQALFLGAGVLHCYLKGFGVEIMGSSDNVVRAGLTGKPVNRAELLRITDPDALPLQITPAVTGEYDTPSPEFRLRRIQHGAGGRLPGSAPRILLCTAGTATIEHVRLRKGQSIFIPAAHSSPTVSVNGEIFCAEPGTRAP
ncbi:mannose-6-phosphate isomerase, class I [Streptosporangium canum]|uniref:mannose-6-phosphate isomerase, class I n=1 Tax=Streptosporangium canum TaxID=324952 RepID=UPI00339F4902